MRKGLREAGARFWRLWSVSWGQWEINEKFQARAGTGSALGCFRPPAETCVLSDSRIKESLFHYTHGLVSRTRKQICSHLLARSEEKSGYIERGIIQMKRTVKGEKGWSKSMLGRRNALLSTFSLPLAPKRVLYKYIYKDTWFSFINWENITSRQLIFVFPSP